MRSDCRSRSEKVGSRSKILDRDPRFSDRDPKRIAIGGRIENRIETISNPTQGTETENDYAAIGTAWYSYASSRAKLVPSVVLGTRDYPQASKYFSQNYGISLYGYIQWA